jgi:hypothetical protein
MNDTVYAFGAIDPAQSAPLWRTSFLDADAVVVPVQHTDVGLAPPPFSNISGNIGIESTPVVDRASGTVYVVAKTKDANGVQSYRLHARRSRHLRRVLGRADGRDGRPACWPSPVRRGWSAARKRPSSP